jgi:hypothetical protein
MPLHGRAEILVEAVVAIGLQVNTSEPPPRHAEINGWPAAKPAIVSLAQLLAARASYQPRL